MQIPHAIFVSDETCIDHCVLGRGPGLGYGVSAAEDVCGDDSMSMGKLGYDYRSDGMFLIRRTCRHCLEPYEVLACANSRPEDVYGLCDACEFVRKQESA